MTEPEDFEAFLCDRLHRKADAVAAPAGAVSTIVRRSHRRRARHRAAGALAGAGALVLGGVVVARADADEVVTVSSDGGAGGGTTTPGSTPGSTPGTPTGPVDPTATSTVVGSTPPGSTPPFATTGNDLVPGVGGGLLSNELRIEVSPSTRLADGAEVTVRGSRFPVGAQILLIECTTHGLGAASLRDAAGNCDTTSQLSVAPAPGAVEGADGSTPDIAEDGTFTSTFRVKRNVSTMGGAFDCALGGLSEDAGIELRELLDAGTLGPSSFPPGTYGCSVVAVVESRVPIADGSYLVEYASATAQILHFDPLTLGNNWGEGGPTGGG